MTNLWKCFLQNGFNPGSVLEITGNVHDNADRLEFNLVCGNTKRKHKSKSYNDVAFHFNPRLNGDIIARNTNRKGRWGKKEREGGILIKKGSDFVLKIVCEEEGYRVQIDGVDFIFYFHRISPQEVTHLHISGLFSLRNIMYNFSTHNIPSVTNFSENMDNTESSQFSSPIDTEAEKKEKQTPALEGQHEKSKKKNAMVKYNMKDGSKYKNCFVELNWISSDSDLLDSCTLTLINVDGIAMLQFSVIEIVGVIRCSEPRSPRIAIYTPHLPVSKILRLQFASDSEMEDFVSHLMPLTCRIKNVREKLGPSTIWATTTLGDIFAYDSDISKKNHSSQGLYSQEFDVVGKRLPFKSILLNGFGPGSVLEISVYVHSRADRLFFDLECEKITSCDKKTTDYDVVFHFNPRLMQSVILRNTYQNGQWGDEEKAGGCPIEPGSNFILKITCETNGYSTQINDTDYIFYSHRMQPQNITHLKIDGLMTLYKIAYKSPSVIIEPLSMFWRQIRGHLKKVETCSAGITWGIGNDSTAWVYTGECREDDLQISETTGNVGISPMLNTQNFYIYQNQRWNPLTGYTAHGFPTDRYMWSDETGREKLTRENTKLPSSHWHWISDWIVDFHPPGGADCEGWQYAVDFLFKYHPKKHFTDFVRRRRWSRKCQLKIYGPWQEVEKMKLFDVSLYMPPNSKKEDFLHVWAVAVNGQAWYRRGVSKSCPNGTAWEHVLCYQDLVQISCGPDGQVWAVGKNGSSYWRFKITPENPTGTFWNDVKPPLGAHLKQLSVGNNVVWALDTKGRLSLRRGIDAKIFPEGTHWQTLSSVHEGFRYVSVGREPGQVWVISEAGTIYRRIGITEENPAGTGWVTGIGANWQHMSMGGLVN